MQKVMSQQHLSITDTTVLLALLINVIKLAIRENMWILANFNLYRGFVCLCAISCQNVVAVSCSILFNGAMETCGNQWE